MGILQFKDENGHWVSVPAVTGERGPQGEPGPQGEQGDMAMAVYDPQGKAQDVFAYADAKATEIKNIIAGGLLQRLKHCRIRLQNYLDGKEETLPELEENLLDFWGNGTEYDKFTPCQNHWGNTITPNQLN